MDSDDSAEVEGERAGSVNWDASVVGRIVLCGVIGRGSEIFRRGNQTKPCKGMVATTNHRSPTVERLLTERGVYLEDDQDDQLLLGIGLFRTFALLQSQQTQWHSQECRAMYSTMASTSSSEPAFPGAILVPVVVAAEFATPIPFRVKTHRAWWWLLADWRKTLMMDGVTTVI